MKKYAVAALPEEYREIFSVDLQKDKKAALLINLGALLITAVMVVPAAFLVPITSLFDITQGMAVYFIRLGTLLVGMIAYIILHELVHGIAMKFYGCERVKYGFTGMYAYAGSDNFFPKKSYIVIALAPVVFWGIVLAVISFFVPLSWFWIVYIIQITNISGAAGDIYVTAKFSKMPDDILVADSGVGMKVYSAKQF